MPRSAPRSTTLPSEVTMQPKATLVTFRPVLPRVRYSNLMSEARLAGACDWGLAERDADAIAGNPIPATRKLRREESMVPPGLTPFPGVNILLYLIGPLSGGRSQAVETGLGGFANGGAIVVKLFRSP